MDSDRVVKYSPNIQHTPYRVYSHQCLSSISQAPNHLSLKISTLSVSFLKEALFPSNSNSLETLKVDLLVVYLGNCVCRIYYHWEVSTGLGGRTVGWDIPDLRGWDNYDQPSEFLGSSAKTRIPKWTTPTILEDKSRNSKRKNKTGALIPKIQQYTPASSFCVTLPILWCTLNTHQPSHHTSTSHVSSSRWAISSDPFINTS